MAAKIVLAFCAQAFIIQCAFTQCPANIGAPWALQSPAQWNGLGLPASYGACGVSSTGGGFPVTSSSPIAPYGIKIVSENAIEGALSVGGNLPFLGTVAIEGILPTAGSGAVSYGCGSGSVGIVSEGPIATGIVGPAAYPPAQGYPYGPGVVGPAYNGLGCGCGAIY